MLLAAFATSVQAQTEKCERNVDLKSSDYVTTRGKNPFIKFDGRKSNHHFLSCPQIGKKRGQSPKCTINIENGFSSDVDVFIDGFYAGSIKANNKGVIDNIEKYSEVYFLSSDNKQYWKEFGDCSCVYSFKLDK